MKHQWFHLNHLQACRLKYKLSRQCIIFANKDAWMIHCVFDVIFNHGSILNLLNITWRVIKICYRSVLHFVSVCKQCSPVREDFIWKKNTKHKEINYYTFVFRSEGSHESALSVPHTHCWNVPHTHCWNNLYNITTILKSNLKLNTVWIIFKSNHKTKIQP